MTPSPPQLRVLETMESGAELYRYEHPNAADRWSLRNVPPTNATVLVRAQVASAMRCAGYIAAGESALVGGGRRQRWTMTEAGAFVLAEGRRVPSVARVDVECGGRG